jgi:hypothetical protein
MEDNENGNEKIPTRHEFCQEHSGIVSEKNNLKTEITRLYGVIERLETRLPLWATGAISFLTFCIGLSLSWIVHLHGLLNSIPARIK